MTHSGRLGATVHATCLVVGETGILVTGASGSGKTALALALIERAAASGRFAWPKFVCLVADDRVMLTRHGDRIVARPVPAIAGQVEIRGLGIRPRPFEPAGVLGLVVQRDVAAPRLPEPADLRTDLLGLALPCLQVGAASDAAALVLARLEGLESAFCDTPVTIT